MASRARAMMPAASGAEADVPVWESVHFDFRSVVICQGEDHRGVRVVGRWWWCCSGGGGDGRDGGVVGVVVVVMVVV